MEVKAGYKLTEVGVIPEDWDVDCIGDAFHVCNQLRLPISQSVRERIAGPYPYYGPTSVQGWINEYRVEGEYALIGEDGDHFLKWQSQPMTLLVRGKFNVNNHAHLVRGTKNLTEWFYWFFAYRDLTPFLTRQGAGRYKLTKAALLKIPCAVPSPSEQRAIAQALSDVDALLGALEQLIAKKRDLKHAAMSQLMTGQIRLPGFEKQSGRKRTTSGLIPKDWDLRPLLSAVQIAQGQIDPRIEPYKSMFLVGPVHVESGTGKLLYRQTAAEQGAISGKYLFSEGDIVYGKINPYLQKAFLADFRGLCSADMYPLRPVAGVSPGFMLAVILGHEFTKHAESVSIRSGMPKINRTEMKEFVFPIPSEEAEQNAIAAVLTDIDRELAALEQRLSKTRALKLGMMQELLTGRVRLVYTESPHSSERLVV